MNKSELIRVAAAEAGVTMAITRRSLAVAVRSIAIAVSAGERVTMPGFGTFVARQRKERVGWNVRTRREFLISACIVPRFNAAKRFKDAVSNTSLDEEGRTKKMNKIS